MTAVKSPGQHLRTDRKYNLELIDSSHCDDYGFPQIAPVDEVPEKLVGWSDSTRSASPESAVHFFTDDYRFESVWNAPQRYVPRLQNYGAALTPDFSLYTDMPIPMQIWNVYRSRAIGNYWQRQGITVIPTLQWSTPDSYVFALEGITEGSVVAVSTVGVRRDKTASFLWKEGMTAALDKIDPSVVMVFGDPVDGFDFGNHLVRYYEHSMARRFADGRQRIVKRDGKK